MNFRVTEDEFRSVFPDIQFQEIQEASDYSVVTGHQDDDVLSTFSGLVYHEVWDNQGGVDILFDRTRNVAVYSRINW